ncbi:MAG TPA: hypothetical protein VGY97_04820 [Solirubrobacteraceae bacterium]|nr:hypothetical protein [Solirubrobacteraceae bacterium]
MAAISALAVVGALLVVEIGASGAASGQRASQARRPRVLSCPHTGTGKRDVALCKKGRGRTGPSGPAGPPGPTGPGGPSPAASADIVIPRTAIPFTTNFMSDGGNVQNLAKVGPIHIDALCRRTFAPGTGGGERQGSGQKNTTRYPDPRLPANGGESEAQILVWTETGSVSFKGQVGPRSNIPAGPPDYTAETTVNVGPGLVPNKKNAMTMKSPNTDNPVSDPVAGEGDHLFVAASNETVDENRATDPAADNPSNPSVRKLTEYPAFNFATGIIATSDGHMVKADLMGGFDVLGVYGECVFAGVVSQLT